RIGLERFFDVVWPELSSESPEFFVIGDVRKAPPALAEKLNTVKCMGYVPDLGSILHPFDLHVIPWEHSTGQRTRLVMAFNYGQTVIAVRASIAGFPEARDGENCRLVDRLDQMGNVIKELLNDPAQRERLGRAARRTFETCFMRQALLPRY